MDLKTVESLKDLIRKDASEEDCFALAAFCKDRGEVVKKTRIDGAMQEAEQMRLDNEERIRKFLEEKHGVPYIPIGTKNGKKKRAKAPASVAVYKSGHRYQHPDKPELTWNGHGKKPEWEKDVVARGGKLIDLGPVQKTDSLKNVG